MTEDNFFATVGTATRPARGGTATADGPSVSHSGQISAISGASSWATSDGTFWSIGESYKTLPPGLYRCADMPGIGPCFQSARNDTDDLIVLPDSESERIVSEIRRFQGMKAKFSAHGFLHKRGVLMWGPPGSGKTTTLQLLVHLIVREHSGVAVMIDAPSMAVACLQRLRRVEPDRQIIGILEDLDGLVERYGESEYLALLDGESQVDNVVYVATTNYPERLDRRFVDRPSRFDTVRYIPMPGEAARRVYLHAKAPGLGGCLDDFVNASAGYSVAHLRELIILTQCFEMTLAEAKERLDATRHDKPASDKAPDRPSFGFQRVA